ncbi:MAG: TetR/AcrR family transcriptional regulator [Anaerolineales bacterium]|nr:TetR/AcrR family transcriptional regulator [Anaerolineales bacterium]
MTPPNSEKTKEKILIAARNLFSKKGFDSATTREIADNAEVNEVTLFRHFQTKENLLNSVIGKFSALPDLSRIIQNKMTGDLEKDLTIFSNVLLVSMRDRCDDMRLMLCESHKHEGLRKVMAGIPAQLRSMIRKYLESQQAADIVRDDLDTEVTAQAFLGLFFAYTINTYMLKHPLDTHLSEEEICSQFVQLFISGIKKD